MNLPDSVVIIGKYAFKHCENLEDITTSAKTVGKGSFLKCSSKVVRKMKKNYPDSTSGDKLAGMTIVITGDLIKLYSRNSARLVIEKHGGKLSGSVSSNTSFVVTNYPNEMTEKLRKAKEEGVPVIDEQTFLKMLK